MNKRDYQDYIKEMMKTPGAKKLRKILAPKSIYGMFKWVKEHADYLVWFENYPETAISDILGHFSKTVSILAVSTNSEAHDDCLNLSIATVIEMECSK